MRALSAATRHPDAFRAGLQLGAALAPIQPEVVFLYSTEPYIVSDDLLQGLYDGLGRDETVIIGSCGTGFYETHAVGDIGASALGLNSGGRIRWHLGIGRGVREDPAGATRAALAAASAPLAGRQPSLIYLTADFRTDSALIEQVLAAEVTAPVVGGLAFGNEQFNGCAVFANRQCLEDCVLILAAEGPLRLELLAATRFPLLGRPGIVEVAEGTILSQISGVSAREFIARERDELLPPRPQELVPLCFTGPDAPDVQRVRSVLISLDDDEIVREEGPVELFGGMRPGQQVQICHVNEEILLTQVRDLSEQLKDVPFTPAAALMVSCAGRRQYLGERVADEVRMLWGGESPWPLAGFSSGGEFASVRTPQGYGRSFLHNMAFVVLLLDS